jgi:hypothetical protein
MDGRWPTVARSEARIFTSIWKDQDFLALPPSAQRLYMFLLSQDDLTYCGVMPLRERRWASKAVGLTLAEVKGDLKELEGTAYPSDYPSDDPSSETCRAPFIITDPDTGELMIRSLMRRDGAWKQPNLLKQAIESAEQVESPRIRAALAAEMRRLPVGDSPSEQVRTLVAQFTEDLVQGSPYPSGYPEPDPPDNPPDNPPENPPGDPSGNSRPRARLLRTPISLSPTDMSAPPARDRKTGTRMPDPFPVTAEMARWAREHAPHVDVGRETERFADHWRGKPGKDGRKLDWTATWRNWMRTAEDRQGPRQRASPGASRPSTTDQRIADAQALKARLTARPQEPT